jgi:hypothetical protein
LTAVRRRQGTFFLRMKHIASLVTSLHWSSWRGCAAGALSVLQRGG